MATKSLRVSTVLQPVVSVAVPVVPAGKAAVVIPTPAVANTIFNTYFLKGETAYYTYNGVQLPVVVAAVIPGGTTQADGSNVLYTVIGDLTGTAYPKNQSYGPFKGVAASLLATR